MGAAAGHAYPVEILHLLVSPGHNYFGRPKDGPGDHPTYDLDEVELVTGRGIVGDRFFGKAAHLDAAVTLFAVEALEAIAAELDLQPVPDPLLTRRNVILRGADVNGLRGQEFTLSGDGWQVTLYGGRPAAPCVWMDRVMVPGVHRAMRGRGGLRCRVVEGGRLRRGPALLRAPEPLDPAAAGLAAVRARPLP
jgi:MOSC domain-containing protein YiiM